MFGVFSSKGRDMPVDPTLANILSQPEPPVPDARNALASDRTFVVEGLALVSAYARIVYGLPRPLTLAEILAQPVKPDDRSE
jgi:hypothetical protein